MAMYFSGDAVGQRQAPTDWERAQEEHKARQRHLRPRASPYEFDALSRVALCAFDAPCGEYSCSWCSKRMQEAREALHRQRLIAAAQAKGKAGTKIIIGHTFYGQPGYITVPEPEPEIIEVEPEIVEAEIVEPDPERSPVEQLEHDLVASDAAFAEWASDGTDDLLSEHVHGHRGADRLGGNQPPDYPRRTKADVDERGPLRIFLRRLRAHLSRPARVASGR